jgi:hypothetical protein
MGILFTDADKDHSQRALGNSFNFAPQGAAGARVPLSEDLALDAEFLYQHISNAGLSERNTGINAMGARIGIAWFFGPPAPRPRH